MKESYAEAAVKGMVVAVVLIAFTLTPNGNCALAGDGGGITGGIDILLNTANAMDKSAMEREAGAPKEYRDGVSKKAKDAIVEIAAMRDVKLTFGDLIRNVFAEEYLISIYNAKVDGHNAAIALLWNDVRLLTSVIFSGENLVDLQDALRRGPESLRMVLRDYYLTRHIDIDHSLSIVGDLTPISLDGAPPGGTSRNITHADLVSDSDKEKAAEYVQRMYGRAIKVTDLKENLLVGSVLVCAYDADIDDQSTGALLFFYRQTEEGTFQPLRDPAATWRKGWLEHILKTDAETKKLLLTDLLRDICIDPNFPAEQVMPQGSPGQAEKEP